MHGMVSRNVAEGNIDKECMTMGERARERERERERKREIEREREGQRERE